MTPEDVMEYYGSTYSFHKITGMAANSLSNWIKWGYVPEGAQYKLERLTNGKLKADGKTIKDEETTEEILERVNRILKSLFKKEISNFINKYCGPSSRIYPNGERVVKDVLNELIKEMKGKKK